MKKYAIYSPKLDKYFKPGAGGSGSLCYNETDFVSDIGMASHYKNEKTADKTASTILSIDTDIQVVAFEFVITIVDRKDYLKQMQKQFNEIDTKYTENGKINFDKMTNSVYSTYKSIRRTLRECGLLQSTP